MRTFAKKSLVLLICLTFAFSPAMPTTKVAQASILSDYGGELAITALGCSGVLDTVTSALTSITNSFTSQSVPVSDGSTHSKESCLDAIAYTAAKIVLAKITDSTLNWINSGFQGSPTFVQNPSSFFTSISDEEVSTFTAKIAFDPARYPFGRFAAQNIINSIQNQLDYNASITSGNLLNYNNDNVLPYKQRFDNFTADFLYGGGWDGYLAVTQITNANPFTTYIQSVNRLGPVVNSANQLSNPIAEVTAELQQSGGFLALKKCVEPLDYESERSDTSFTRAQAIAVSKNDPSGSDAQAAKEWLRKHTCTRFETKTPGTAIAQQMNISLGTSQRQLELADELNESISAVFDALIKQLFKKGVSSLSGDDPAGSNVDVLGGYGTNTNGSSLSGTSGTGVANNDQWYNQNRNFDLKEAIAPAGLINDPDCLFSFTVDTAGTIPAATVPRKIITGNIADKNILTNPACNQGIAIIQKAYAEAIRSQAIKLQEAIRWVNYADYCIPGPRPDWYTAASAAVSALQERFSEISQDTDEEDRAKDAYLELKYFTGFAADNGDTVNLRNSSNAYNAIWQTLRENIGGWGYREHIADRYSATNPSMPSVTLLVNQEYSRKAQYQAIIDRSADAAAEAEAMYLRLQNIYNNIRTGEIQFGVGTPTEDTAGFKLYMDNQLKIFSRLVSQMKTIESIENVVADSSVANDEIDYLANPSTGLIKQCVTETVGMSNATRTRRAYGETKAASAEFQMYGWPISRAAPLSYDPLIGYQNQQSFLPGVSITAAGAAGPNSIYIGHYVNSCPVNTDPTYPSVPFALRLDGRASYSGCFDGDGDLTTSYGDRFESHINSY
ncbi:MAG: hypothetical protein KBB70_01165 [Candidatus Pacebacteria bacterium]|nr:hypothetical protein [Candidatus Paceibacterota bacterium]